MNNTELSLAIDMCNESLGNYVKYAAPYEPFINHLKALLAEQLRRATQRNFNSDDNSVPEIISRQAIKIEDLENENARLKESIARAIMHIICIQGPLNGNKLGYSTEQLYTFGRIKYELEN